MYASNEAEIISKPMMSDKMFSEPEIPETK
jgi:hypothetical protein